MAYIYKIKNDINNKLYIGKTNNSIEERWSIHKKDAKKRVLYEKRPLYNAMNKYGIDHFYIEEIEQCDDELAEERERYWISFYNTYNDGYNATLGGDGKNLYNHQEIAKLLKEDKSTKEICDIIGCCSDIVSQVAKNYNINLVLNAQNRQKEKMSKKVAQYDKNMNYIQTFNSVADAARWLYEYNIIPTLSSGVRTHIAEVCNGKRKTAYKSIWKYI